MKKGNVLEIKDLSVDFMTVRGIVYAVQGVDLEVKQGEIHGIVGESGCGKSVTSKSVIRLHNEETTRYAGDIYIRDDSGEKDVLAMSKKQLRDFRGSTAAMIFQDPMTSLDPIMKAGEQIAEMLRAKKNLNRCEAREKVIEMFERIGITPAEKRYEQYPFENKKHILLEGDIPNAVDIPEGCRFAGRCRYFKEGLCDNRTPKLKDIGNGHYVACHFPLGIDRSKTASDM